VSQVILAQGEPTINGYSVWAEMVNGGVVFLVDIDDVQGGSTARFYVDSTITNNPKADISAWRMAFFECLGDVRIKTVTTPERSISETSTSSSATSFHSMDCQTDKDCKDGFSCRTLKNGGDGTECRAHDHQLSSFEQTKAAEQNIHTAQTSEQSMLSKSAMEIAKETCASLGFKIKTEKFGNCVLKITK
jgi:hypothetical protein